MHTLVGEHIVESCVHSSTVLGVTVTAAAVFPYGSTSFEQTDTEIKPKQQSRKQEGERAGVRACVRVRVCVCVRVCACVCVCCGLLYEPSCDTICALAPLEEPGSKSTSTAS